MNNLKVNIPVKSFDANLTLTRASNVVANCEAKESTRVSVQQQRERRISASVSNFRFVREESCSTDLKVTLSIDKISIFAIEPSLRIETQNGEFRDFGNTFQRTPKVF
jgi:hypothetical protein